MNSSSSDGVMDDSIVVELLSRCCSVSESGFEAVPKFVRRASINSCLLCCLVIVGPGSLHLAFSL